MSETPNVTSSPPSSLLKLQSFLSAHPTIKYIRLLMVDYGNVPHVHILPFHRALALASNPEDTSNVQVASPAMALFHNTGTLAFELVNLESDDWVPDWDTLRPTTRPTHGTVMCNLKTTCFPEEEWYALDPRAVLKRVEKDAADHGVEFLVGYEVEFTLLDKMDSETAIGTPKSQWSSGAVNHPSFDFLEAAVDELESVGIPVWDFHPEGAGMFEIALCPQPPFVAVDDLVYTHATIKAIAAKHGYHATMAPKATEKGEEAGQHIHISLTDPGPSSADQFLAGMLAHMRALSAFWLGGHDSWGIRDGVCGRGDVVWGRIKLVPIRQVNTARWELRMPDTLANPYLQLAATIAAGMDGVKKETELTMKPRSGPRDFKPLSEEIKKELGVTQRLPKDFEEALVALKESTVLREAFGDRCFDLYVAHKTMEDQKAKGKTPAERRLAVVQDI